MSSTSPVRVLYRIDPTLRDAPREEQPTSAVIVKYVRDHYPQAGDLFTAPATTLLESMRSPNFTGFRLHNKDVWQQVAVVVFPYTNADWRELVGEVFAFEGHCWRLWCEWTKGQRAGERLLIPPLWYGLIPLSDATNRPLFGGHVIDEFPVLIRPYLPWPTLFERPLPAARLDSMKNVLAKLGRDELSIAGASLSSIPPHLMTSDGQFVVPTWWSLLRPDLSDAVKTLLGVMP